MTRANPGAKIKHPTDWEWHALRYNETKRYCVDCGQAFDPTNRVQKYCLKCKPNHRGKKHYQTKGGYDAWRLAHGRSH